MKNIFENAYFGKPYRTREEKKAIYHYYNEDKGTHHLILEGGETVNCYNYGKNICNDYPTRNDIVSEW